MIDNDRLLIVIRDAITQKRVIKWGYVRNFGGPHPGACDSVASHTAAVSALAVMMAYEIAEELERETGVKLNLQDVPLLAVFHDLGECRSGDTGASSHAVRGVCGLHALEREGLEAVMAGLKLKDRVMSFFDDYRSYSTPEAILVHVADNIEGFEKGLEVGHGCGESVDVAFSIVQENVNIYKTRCKANAQLGLVCDYMVEHLLKPSLLCIANAYRLPDHYINKIINLQATI